jgi:hypothetical protein
MVLPLVAATGFIQIKSESGIQIFIDDNFKGITSNEVKGIILKDIQPGTHVIKAIKPGFQPKIIEVNVNEGSVVPISITTFVPQIKIRQEGNGKQTQVKVKVGSILIQSIPVECVITCDHLGWDKVSKTHDKFLADDIPIGKYKLICQVGDKSLTHLLNIESEAKSELFFDFTSLKVIDLAKIKHEESIKARETAEIQKMENERREEILKRRIEQEKERLAFEKKMHNSQNVRKKLNRFFHADAWSKYDSKKSKKTVFQHTLILSKSENIDIRIENLQQSKTLYNSNWIDKRNKEIYLHRESNQHFTLFINNKEIKKLKYRSNAISDYTWTKPVLMGSGKYNWRQKVRDGNLYDKTKNKVNENFTIGNFTLNLSGAANEDIFVKIFKSE